MRGVLPLIMVTALLLAVACHPPGARRAPYAPVPGSGQHFPSRYTPHNPEYYWQDRLGQCAFPAQIPPTVIWCQKGS